MRVIVLIILLALSQLAVAAEPTIYQSSVQWDDLSARASMLERSETPEWGANVITSLYEVYKQPKQHQVPDNKNDQKFNTAFIDEYWGPITNPFVKYSRPAKVFAYVGKEDQLTAYMAPIVKSTTDGNYYVFNRATSKAQLLEEWIDQIKVKSQANEVKFSVCNGYGNLPTDTCIGRSYQAEETFALNSGANGRDGVHGEAVVTIPSAYRASNQDWRKYATSNAALMSINAKPGSISSSSVSWANEIKRNQVLQTATTWANYKTISENFEKLRDIRYFDDRQVSGFKRRISWMYPDDGCWTRASAVVNHLFGAVNNEVNKFPRPSKVFAFGNLCANTTNHPDGRVNWWYHTAPLIRDAETNQTYVLDPSIDSHKPLTVEAWVAAISANTGPCANDRHNSVDKINVCTGFGAGPGNVCVGNGSDFANEAREALRQSQYQDYERERQLELMRDPDKVLGDGAPWL